MVDAEKFNVGEGGGEEEGGDGRLKLEVAGKGSGRGKGTADEEMGEGLVMVGKSLSGSTRGAPPAPTRTQ